jgi:hypothetical protein
MAGKKIPYPDAHFEPNYAFKVNYFLFVSDLLALSLPII